ncbi:hypothetical protein [Geopsychrobacter electrodiphilus]|uniref:hypothetical protein n=1 Tax=Geopsychrobacter electrodiphilus TaxID=225196 RepID=UPI000368BA23|nr:hypothetical protein [Geopsychrobacter electrodiphilus]
MGLTPAIIPFAELSNVRTYDIESLETEITADRCCKQLLKAFHRWLLDERRSEALEAGRLAAGVDYFLCDFMIGARRQNIFQATAEQLRQFGGNWYIVSNLEPNLPELEPMLRGTSLFYKYAVELDLVDSTIAEEIEQAAAQVDFYQGRIDAFYQLQDDEYRAWNQACPLK